PGHVFPLRARKGGVLVRSGQTEGSVDLARLAGLEPAGVICEIMNDDGTMARMPDLERYAEKHGLVIVSVADLIRYRLEKERLVQRIAEETVELEAGSFRAIAFRMEGAPGTHLAFVMGEVATDEPVLVRVQARCSMGEVFGSTACGCGHALRQSLRRIAEEGRGALVHLHREAETPLRCTRMHDP